MPIATKRMQPPAAGSQTSAAPGPLTTRDGIPWELWCGALAVSCSTYGLEWDLSWHYSIGRDGFWTPAHMVIYLCGVLSGVVCSYLLWTTNFGKSAERRSHSVSVFGLRAPLGCFIAAWGGLAMLVSAPFDNWWHNAYGLDAQVITPPHALLLIGMDLIAFGFLLLAASYMNRAGEAKAPNYKALQRLFFYVGGLALFGHMLAITQVVERPWLHTSLAYKAVAFAVTPLLILISWASRHPWAATCTTLTYTLFRILAILIFPLFPATPKLGPVLNPITHFVPQEFPILILVPAIALDLLWQHTRKLPGWLIAGMSGVVFGAVIDLAEWFFADFLQTKAAANRFFGTIYYPRTTSAVDRVPHFARAQGGWPLFHGLVVAAMIAMIGSWIGLQLGRWMRSVQR